MLTEIVFSGFGGQGILFAGKCLAHSAMTVEKEISWLPSYGPEKRGGTANCSVCISDRPIGSPLVTEPDILVVMNTPSFDRFEHAVKSGGKLFCDSSIAERTSERKDIECFYIPASSLAAENHLDGMANIIMLGKMVKECAGELLGITIENIEESFRKIIPKAKEKLAEKNIKALEIGMAL
ncbi:MAG: 2-oxoacid:acceptor oxidoreductase family protein [Oscillospiraceae bacterium]